MSKPQAHVRIDFTGGGSLGPGKIALLESIARTGSLSAAGRSLGMSYRRAWLLLHSVNDSFAEPAVTFSVGGKDGGGARLTPFGRKLIDAYRAFESSVDSLAVKAFAGLKPTGSPAPAAEFRRRPLRRKVEGEAIPRGSGKKGN